MQSHTWRCLSRVLLPSLLLSQLRLLTKHLPHRSQLKRFLGFISHVAACLSHRCRASEYIQLSGPLESAKVLLQCSQVAFAGFFGHTSMWASRSAPPSLENMPNVVTKFCRQYRQAKRLAGFIPHFAACASLASGFEKICPQKQTFAGLFSQPISWASRCALPSQAMRPMTPKRVTYSR